MIIYKVNTGLCTFMIKDPKDLPVPNYPMPAIPVRVKHGSWFVIVQDGIHLSVYFWAMKGLRYGFISTRNRHSCYD